MSDGGVEGREPERVEREPTSADKIVHGDPRYRRRIFTIAMATLALAIVAAGVRAIALRINESRSGRVAMISIAEGTARIGDDAQRDEAPAHSVLVKAFSVDARLVSVAAFRRCVHAGGCIAPAKGQGCHYDGADDDAPVDCVTWFQADAFCKVADKRLIDEVEWEHAMRSAARQLQVDGSNAEWTASDYCGYADVDCHARTKVTRGGEPAGGRLTARRSLEPGGWSANLGFRCAR